MERHTLNRWNVTRIGDSCQSGSVQVIGYETRVSEERPALLVGTEGTVRRLSLEPGAELTYTLGERRCAGTIDGDRHLPCDATAAPYCSAHTSRWPCARCVGDCHMPIEACHEEHAVYLAAFAPKTFKVGVTRSWRLETRLEEQGADRAAHVFTVVDGRIAREIEAEIATEIADRIRIDAKIAGLARSVDEAAWNGLLEGFDVMAEFSFEYGLSLSERPVREVLATGTVVGTQGRILVLSRGGSVYAVDMRDLVGHHLSEGATERELQSSLGAFGAGRSGR